MTSGAGEEYAVTPKRCCLATVEASIYWGPRVSKASLNRLSDGLRSSCYNGYIGYTKHLFYRFD